MCGSEESQSELREEDQRTVFGGKTVKMEVTRGVVSDVQLIGDGKE